MWGRDGEGGSQSEEPQSPPHQHAGRSGERRSAGTSGLADTDSSDVSNRTLTRLPLDHLGQSRSRNGVIPCRGQGSRFPYQVSRIRPQVLFYDLR